MWKVFIFLTGVVAWLLSVVPEAHSQKATEVYIPLGRSPALSSTVTVIGMIQVVSTDSRTIVITGPNQETWSAGVTDRTSIWLDRSKLQEPNQVGTFASLQEGLTVEVKYRDNEQRGRGHAEWIKVQVE